MKCPDAVVVMYPLKRSTFAVELCSRFGTCQHCRPTWDGLGDEGQTALTDQIRRNAVTVSLTRDNDH